MCDHSKGPAFCEGHRCPLGECIPEKRVCDKVYPYFGTIPKLLSDTFIDFLLTK